MNETCDYQLISDLSETPVRPAQPGRPHVVIIDSDFREEFALSWRNLHLSEAGKCHRLPESVVVHLDDLLSSSKLRCTRGADNCPGSIEHHGVGEIFHLTRDEAEQAARMIVDGLATPNCRPSCEAEGGCLSLAKEGKTVPWDAPAIPPPQQPEAELVGVEQQH